MATYRMVQGNHIVIVAGGDTPEAAIRATWEREHQVQIISITKPYGGEGGDKCYHIEHSGRIVDWYHDYAKDQKIIYSEELKLEEEVTEL